MKVFAILTGLDFECCHSAERTGMVNRVLFWVICYLNVVWDITSFGICRANSGSGVFLLILFFYSQNLAVFVVDDVLKAYNTFFRGGWAGRLEFRLLFVRSL